MIRQKMHNYSLWMFFVLTLLLLFSSTAYGSDTDKASIWLNDEKLNYQVPAMMENGIVYVPLREFFEDMGAQVSWNGKSNEITVITDSNLLNFKIGSNHIFFNGKSTDERKSTIVQNGTTMIDARLAARTMNFQIKWKENDYRVNLYTVNPNTTTSSAILTYDDAVNLGIRKSSSYQKALINADKAVENNENLYLNAGQYNPAMLQGKKDLTIAEKWSEMQIGLTLEGVATDIKNQMDDITLLHAEKEIGKQKIDYLEYNLKMERLKYENGMTSALSLKNEESKYEQEVQNLASADKKIEGAYIKLNAALGYPKEQRDSFEYDVTYQELGVIDLEDKIRKDTYSDPFLWLADQQIDSANLKLLTFEYNMGGNSYTITSLNLTQAKQNKKDTQDNLRQTIMTRYNELLQLEEAHKGLLLKLDQAKLNLATMQIQYDAGLITKAQLLEAQLNIPSLEYEIKKIEQQHEQAKVVFMKPYLMPQYFSAS